MRKHSNKMQQVMAWLTVFAIFAMPVSVFSQTQIKYHSNKYKPADDVKVGRQAATEVEQQMPILNDSDATSYVSRVGQRLVSSIPSEFQHPEFSYYFKIVNARDINAFALPGGPMYVNRGMIEAARNTLATKKRQTLAFGNSSNPGQTSGSLPQTVSGW